MKTIERLRCPARPRQRPAVRTASEVRKLRRGCFRVQRQVQCEAECPRQLFLKTSGGQFPTDAIRRGRTPAGAVAPLAAPRSVVRS